MPELTGAQDIIATRNALLEFPDMRKDYEANLRSASTSETLATAAGALLGAGLGIFVQNRIDRASEERAKREGREIEPSTEMGKLMKRIVSGGVGALGGYLLTRGMIDGSDMQKRWRQAAADRAINLEANLNDNQSTASKVADSALGGIFKITDGVKKYPGAITLTSGAAAGAWKFATALGNSNYTSPRAAATGGAIKGGLAGALVEYLLRVLGNTLDARERNAEK